jgi:hypothetical protein
LGNSFGQPLSGQQVPTGGRVLFGSRDATIVSWTNGSITFFPTAGSNTGTYTVIVINSGGSSRAPGQFTLTVTGTATSC